MPNLFITELLVQVVTWLLLTAPRKETYQRFIQSYHHQPHTTHHLATVLSANNVRDDRRIAHCSISATITPYVR